MKYYCLLFLAAISSCGSPPESKERIQLIASYGVIRTGFTSRRPLEQLFIDKSAAAIIQVKTDNRAVIETKNLRTLLDSARASNKEFMDELAYADEPDTAATLKYKASAVAYTQLLDSLYTNEFPQLLQILASPDTNRLSEIAVLLPRLEALRTAGNTCVEAGEALKKKHNFQAIDVPAGSAGN